MSKDKDLENKPEINKKDEAADDVLFPKQIKIDTNAPIIAPIDMLKAIFSHYKCPFCGAHSVNEEGHIACRELADEFMHEVSNEIDKRENDNE